jgi:hypothetical protein
VVRPPKWPLGVKWLTSALDMVGAQRNASAALPPGKESRYSLYRRLGGPQGPSGRVWKTSPPTGIRSPDLPARSESLYRLASYWECGGEARCQAAGLGRVLDFIRRATKVQDFAHGVMCRWRLGTVLLLWTGGRLNGN